MLRGLWVSPQAQAVFRAHPLGVILSGLRREQVSALPQQNVKRLVERAESLTGFKTFEQLRLPPWPRTSTPASRRFSARVS
ncbi:MAG: hypothetical protein E6I34_07080 [Chloroflexi bacterium]|nr:MAG: hypothetical protein E6I34_07080 [Chloroflexota bacterium]